MSKQLLWVPAALILACAPFGCGSDDDGGGSSSGGASSGGTSSRRTSSNSYFLEEGYESKADGAHCFPPYLTDSHVVSGMGFGSNKSQVMQDGHCCRQF